MFKFIHAADIHLDSPLKGLEAHEGAPVEEIRGATRRAFDNLIDLTVEEKADFLLIGGDLYDGDWKDYNTGLYFVSRMGKLRQAGVKVFLISGNHDAASQITRTMPLPDNVVHFSSREPQSHSLEDLGVIIHGQSYHTKAVTDNLVSGYPRADSHYFNIGLLHTSLTGREGHENYAPCNPDELKSKGYHYWALGHIHKQEVVSTDPWIVFPGNIQGRHIKEAGAKGASVVTVDDNQVAEVEARALDVLRWATSKVDLSRSETVDSVNDAVCSALAEQREMADGRSVIVRLVLTGECPVHGQLFDNIPHLTEGFRALAAGIGDVWLEKVEFRTRRKKSLEEILGRDTPLAGLIESIRKLEFDAASLSELVPELAILKSKLPPEIFGGEELFLEFSPDGIPELGVEVQELLISRLLQHGGEK
jgi:DNA repair exonuclease SbcCD nuclease subunit